MPVKARAGGQGRVRGGRVGAQQGTGGTPSPPTGDPSVGAASGSATVSAVGTTYTPPSWVGPSWSPTDHREFVTVSGTNNEIATRNNAAGGAHACGRSDIGQTTGVRDVEMTITQKNSSSDMLIGVGNGAADLSQFAGYDNNSIGWSSVGYVLINSGFAPVSGGAYTTGDVIGLRIDLDANTIAMKINGGTLSSTNSIAALRPASDPIFIMYSIPDTVNDAVTLNNV